MGESVIYQEKVDLRYYKDGEEMTKPLTIFHITHPKAGSQWIRAILTQAAPDRIRDPLPGAAQIFNRPIKSGKIYPCVYLGRGVFDTIVRFNPKQNQLQKLLREHPKTVHPGVMMVNLVNVKMRRFPYKIFVVIRDLRDTFVSLYFSLKNTHPILKPFHSKYRDYLLSSSKEEGFMFLFEEYKHFKNIQITWQQPEYLYLKYEDLIQDEKGIFKEIFDYCEINISRNAFNEIVERNTFTKITGRKPGEEDRSSHYRKGIVGDWKNHFSSEVKEDFKRRFGEVLIQTGYEKDLSW